MTQTNQPSIIIAGAGLSGLTAAHAQHIRPLRLKQSAQITAERRCRIAC